MKVIETKEKIYWHGGVIECRNCGTKLQVGMEDLFSSKKWNHLYEFMHPGCTALAGSVSIEDIDPAERPRAKQIARKNRMEATKGLERPILSLVFLDEDHPVLTIVVIILALMALGMLGGLIMRIIHAL